MQSLKNVKPQSNPTSTTWDEEFMKWQRNLFLSLFNPNERRENRFERFMSDKITKNQNQSNRLSSSSQHSTPNSSIPKITKPSSKFEVSEKFAKVVEVEKSRVSKVPRLKINIVEKDKTLHRGKPRRRSAIKAIKSFQNIDDDDDDDDCYIIENFNLEGNITTTSQGCQQLNEIKKRKSSEMKVDEGKNYGYNPPKSKVIKLTFGVEKRNEEIDEILEKSITRREPRKASMKLLNKLAEAQALKTARTIRRKTPTVPRKSRKTSITPSPQSSPTNNAIVPDIESFNTPSIAKRLKTKKSITPRLSTLTTKKLNSPILSDVTKASPTVSKSFGVDQKSSDNNSKSENVSQIRSKMTLIPKAWKKSIAINNHPDPVAEAEVFVTMTKCEFLQARMKKINALNAQSGGRRTRKSTNQLEQILKLPTNIKFKESDSAKMSQSEFLCNFDLAKTEESHEASDDL